MRIRRKRHGDIFERLEKEASDELQLLSDLGPKSFDTDHLMELHALVCEKINMQQRLIRIALSIGATGVGWVFLGVVSMLLDFQILTIVSFCLAAVGLSTFIGIQLYAISRYQTKGHLDHTRLSIEDELRRRRDRYREQMS
ncbi:MAG: hypothetical protein R2778_14400 [Saprospiraceae bacterium]|nr:hypothetical protein [Lewinellaceae bacterium]